MTLYQRFTANVTLRRIVVLLSVMVVLYLSRSMMTTILLTFIFTYLAIRFVRLIQHFFHIPTALLSLLLYAAIIFGVYLALTKYIPIVIHQSVTMYDSVVDFYDQQPEQSNQIIAYVHDYLEKMNLMDQVKNGATVILSYLQDFGKLAVAFAMSFILSFFYMVETKKMRIFSRRFLHSEFSWYFQDLYYFAQKFVNTFGVVLEAQFFIAVVNTVLTILGLTLIGLHQIPSLAIMVFLLSLIPVAGVIISCIPLSFVAYSEGGLNSLIYVLLLIIVIHLLEAYILNPKFMSSKTELPIFYTFVILLVSERLFGVWGLIVGIPIATFFLDILKVKPIKDDLPLKKDDPA